MLSRHSKRGSKECCWNLQSIPIGKILFFPVGFIRTWFMQGNFHEDYQYILWYIPSAIRSCPDMATVTVSMMFPCSPKHILHNTINFLSPIQAIVFAALKRT